MMGNLKKCTMCLKKFKPKSKFQICVADFIHCVCLRFLVNTFKICSSVGDVTFDKGGGEEY